MTIVSGGTSTVTGSGATAPSAGSAVSETEAGPSPGFASTTAGFAGAPMTEGSTIHAPPGAVALAVDAWSVPAPNAPGGRYAEPSAWTTASSASPS